MAKAPKSIMKSKGAKSEVLPSRHALTTLTAPPETLMRRTMNDYAKKTPIGANAAPAGLFGLVASGVRRP